MKESNTAVHVAKGASYLLIQNLGTALLQVVAFYFIARLIVPADMGILAAMTLVVTLSSVLVDLGLANAATKFIAEHRGKNDLKTARSIFYQILRASLIFSVGASLLCFVFAEAISLLLLRTSNYTILFILLAFDVLPSGIFACLYNSLVGLQKIREAAILNLLFRQIIKQTIFVSLLLLNFGLLGLTIAWLTADTIIIFLYLSIILKSLGSPNFDFSLKRLLQFSYPLYISNVIGFAYNWFDRAIMLAFLTLSTLGIYDVVLRAFGVLNGITISISTALFAKYSELHGKGGIGAVERAIPAASRYVCLIAMPLAFGLSALGTPAITLFAGESYASGSQPLVILSLFFAVTCIQTALSGILLIIEKTRIVTGLTVVNIIVGLVSAIALMPSFGIVGASLARGLTMLSSLLLTVWIMRKKIHMSFDIEAFWKSLFSSVVMFVTLSGVGYFWSSTSFLPIYLVFGTLVYLVMLRILGAAREEDIALLKSYVGERFKFLVKPMEILLGVRP